MHLLPPFSPQFFWEDRENTQEIKSITMLRGTQKNEYINRLIILGFVKFLEDRKWISMNRVWRKPHLKKYAKKKDRKTKAAVEIQPFFPISAHLESAGTKRDG